ncbi:MAG: hypothetical protein K9J16_12900 [Melioribacteraceae bacterium]|nr:hypothetical protein [Melioribacteraceae bacterium]MCF8353647.1 hypothetical protein [Melioribacteraceae bacterium]MCF8393417.1 hypothetical protein [Melioribacteraceae bacterium]MCF8419274.1 hypothetical protein [Melioribacteraceae bacterium]
MARQIRTTNEFKDRLLKLIPSEVVAAYMVLHGFITDKTETDLIIGWIVFGVLLLLTPLYLKRFQQVDDFAQLVITSISFAVWVFTIGGPFESFAWYSSKVASVVLVLWTMIIPLAVKPKIE